MKQIPLFDLVTQVYSEQPDIPVNNKSLYRRVAEKSGIPYSEFAARTPIGKSQSLRSAAERQVRWTQQTLKSLGWLEKAPDRGSWMLTPAGKNALTTLTPEASVSLVAFSTQLGIAIWADCRNAFKSFDQPVLLVVTSPPYPIRRAYGKVELSQYTDFICESLEPLVNNLLPGGSIALNVSNDVFLKGMPARSLYLEHLTIALTEKLGLFLMDRLIWESNKPPGPTYWSSITHTQLNVGYEYVLWFTNNPELTYSDNQRVLQPHTDSHRKFIARGGESRTAIYSDGAYRIRPGSFSNPTDGKIPRNIIKISNVCQSQRLYKRAAEKLALPKHGAPMPVSLARFLIQFLAPPANKLAEDGPFIVDPFGGSLSVPVACEQLGHSWIATETAWEYLRGGAERFHHPVLNQNFLSMRDSLCPNYEY